MTFEAFAELDRQREMRTRGAAYPFEPWYYALGLAGDAGEVADKVKALYRDGTAGPSHLSGQAREALMHELGDVLWYLDALATRLGGSLQHVARMNQDRLDDLERRGVLTGAGRPR